MAVGALIAFAILVLAVFLLLPAPPALLPPKSSRGEPILVPGPILAAISQGVVLDGLTVIPLVHLPHIKFAIPIPFTSHRIFVSVSPTASEVVFGTLRVASFSSRALDASRSPIEVKVAGVDANVTGSFSLKLVVRIEGAVEDLGARSFKWVGSGRLAASVTDARLSLNAQLVQKAENVAPRVEVLSTRVDEGVIHRADIEGFGICGGIATRALPFIQGTVFVRWPVKILGDYLAREILEGPIVDSMLADLFSVARPHVDLETYVALVDSEREDEIATPLDATSLEPPPPPSPDDLDDLPPPSSTSSAETPPPLAETPSAPTQFRLHAHLIGPTRLHSFPLPDFSPGLYRPGGTRAKLQALNPITAQLQLDLTNVALARLSFDRGSLAFDPPSPPSSPGRHQPQILGLGGGELIVTVEDLTVFLTGDFSLGAATSPIVSWTTGIKHLRSSGTSTTTVLARSLQLRFRIVRAKGGRGRATAYELERATMSPFTSITPSFTLDNSLLNRGAELTNQVTKSLATEIGAAVSALLGVFFKDVVRNYIQGLMDGVEERLQEAGVELPKKFRGEDVA